jgi:CheY-like chemotaxis protein
MILIFDASVPVREMMGQVLVDQGYDVADGEVLSVQLVRHHTPALLIVDLPPHKANETLGVIDAIRRDPAVSATPVIVSATSAKLLTSVDEQLRAHGCRTLEKPFELDGFLACVAQSLALRAREVS